MEDRTGQQGPFVKRVTLPSGKEIEVLYFSEAPAAGARAEASSVGAQPLHICPQCDARLVYPTEWEEAEDERWHVWLRCPNCAWEDEGLFTQETVDAFDEELDRGIDVLVEDYRALVSANMADEVERFVQALEADAILPADF